MPWRTRTHANTDRSFLPEDYLERKLEARTNFVALTLFSIVTIAVVAAFLVTSRAWNDVKRYQQAINVRYSQAAKDIEQLKSLESQKSQLLERAELTMALIERVPRTILLAELINRMPDDITLLELELKSSRVQDKPAATDPKTTGKGGSSVAKRTRTDKDAAPAETKGVVAPPKFQTKVIITGVTSTHNSVAKYVSGLQTCPLLTAVELKFSERTMIKDRDMNKFRIESELRSDADARRIEPLTATRIRRSPLESREPGLPTEEHAAVEGKE